MKRILTFCMVVLLCASLVMTGCSKKEEADNNGGTQSQTQYTQDKNDTKAENQAKKSEDDSIVTPAGTFPIVKEKVTLKVLYNQSNAFQDIETNKLTQYMEEKTNVHIDWQLIPQKDMAQKVNLILATQQDIPDVFMGAKLSNITLVKYGSQGLFIPLNNLINKYSVEFKLVEESIPELYNIISAPNGNIYCLPKITEGYNAKWRNKMWMNMNFLDNLGLEKPVTTDDFYNILKSFKEDDPNGNGLADEVPLVGSTTGWASDVDTFLMNAFIYHDGDSRKLSQSVGFIINDGVVDVAYNKPEWKNGLAYMNKLCNEGLLDPVSFTQDDKQLKQLVEKGKDATVGAVPAGGFHVFADVNGERVKQYDTIKPLKGPNGVQFAAHFPYNPVKNGVYVITSECKYPEVAFRWADWMYSEEASLRIRYGVPGVDWVEPKEGVEGINGKQAIIEPIWNIGESQNSLWGFNHPGWNKEKFALGVVKTDPWETNTKLTEVTKRDYAGYEPDEVLPPLFFSAEESEEYNELLTTINGYVRENISRFIVGESNLESDWDAYLNELDNMGLARYIEMTQKAYDRQYKR